MQACVFAVTTVPDVATARRIRGLEDLDDRSVCKILAHERKQRTGGDERLGYDQQAVVAMSLVRRQGDGVILETFALPTHSETDMLHGAFAAAADSDHLATWSGDLGVLPVIRFRALLHRVRLPSALLQANAPSNRLTDVAAGAWQPTHGSEAPGLHDMALKLGYPGLLDRVDFDPVAAWLDGDFAAIRDANELRVLNVFLVALRLLFVQGVVGGAEVERLEQGLRHHLETVDAGNYSAFLQAWKGR